MKKLLIASAVCAAIATTASAESSSDVNVYIGSNLSTMNRMYNGGGMNAMANSLYIGFQLKQLRFELDPTLSYNDKEVKKNNTTDTVKSDVGLAASVYYDFPGSGIITPFVGGSLGFLTGTTEQEVGNTTTKTREDSSFTTGVLGGASLGFAESWKFDVELGLKVSSVEAKFPAPKTTTTEVGLGLGMKLRYMF